MSRTNFVRAQFDFHGPIDTTQSAVLVDQKVDTTGAIPKFGPNRLFFVHGLCQLGGMPGPQVYGLQTNWWSSSLTYGVRMKLKLWSWEALTMDFGYRYDRFSLRKDTPKLPPFSPVVHQRERISIHNFSGSICDRINFGRRGNVMGSWLDFGVYGDWDFRTTDVYVDQFYSSTSPYGFRNKSKTRLTRLPYIEPMNYGFTAKIGGDYLGIFAKWRVNNLVKSEYTSQDRDLPKLIIGIEIYNWD